MKLPVGGDEGPDGDGRLQPLLHIQVTGRLVKHKTEAQGDTSDETFNL